MKIASIDYRILRIPLPKPVAHAYSRHTVRDYVLCRMITDDGLEGYSCGGGAEHLSDLGAVVIGRHPDDVGSIWNDLMYKVRWGRRGAPMMAVSQLDNCLWDIRAKAANKPLYRLIGAARSSVDAYASGGVYTDGEGLTELEAECASYREQGFKAFKIRIGRLTLREDVERVRTARRALGPDIDIGIDANATLTHWDEAVRFLDVVADCNISWFEDPFHPEMHENYRKLTNLSRTPISMGESESLGYAFSHWASTAIVDILQPDVTVIGGVTEWLRVAGLAACHGKTIFPHYFPFLHIHLACSFAAQTVRYVEWVPVHKLVSWDAVFTNEYKPVNGIFYPPDLPGFGLDFDWEKVKHYTVHEAEV